MKKNPLEITLKSHPRWPLLALYGAALAGTATAVETPAAAGFHLPAKPAWLANLSLALKEGYDNNVFLSGVDSQYLPPGYPVPAGSVAALEDKGSWFSAVSPKIGFNFVPLLGAESGCKTLALTYAPDLVRYHDRPSESYDVQRVNAEVKGRTGAVAFGLENAFAYVDGNEFGPTYPGGYVSAFNTAAARERRQQIQNRTAFTLEYDWKQWFVRPNASLAYYDLMTEQINVTGYQNYADRYDVNGGVDFGYKFASHLAVALGYVYGHQDQEQFSFTPYSSPSDYHRVLVSVEGKPWKWLEVKLKAGPDFRNYESDTATHITPVNDKHLLTYFGEATVAATLTARDTLSFKYKQWQWVSSTGKVPYFDSSYTLSYHHQLTTKLGFDLGGRILTADYNSGSLAASARNDMQYTVSTALDFALNQHVSFNLAYALNLGRNAQDDIATPSTREYDQQLVSLGMTLKF